MKRRERKEWEMNRNDRKGWEKIRRPQLERREEKITKEIGVKDKKEKRLKA